MLLVLWPRLLENSTAHNDDGEVFFLMTIHGVGENGEKTDKHLASNVEQCTPNTV